MKLQKLSSFFVFSIIVFGASLSISIVNANEAPPLASDFEPTKYKAREVHQEIKILTEGSGAQRSYAFIPNKPSGKKLPLIIFSHGWMGTNPKNYGALIDHLVRRGSVVIYPVYQTDGNTPPQEITNTAAQSISKTISRLNAEFPDLINTDKTLYYGFSMGASMSINFAMNPSQYGLPAPKGLILVAPGDAHHVAHGALAQSIVLKSIDQLPINLPIILMTGKEDVTIGVPMGHKYWNAICQQNRRKTFISWPGGKNESESIAAGHGAPGAPDDRYDFPDIYGNVTHSIERLENFPISKSMNNLDYYGQWKVITGFLDFLQNGKSMDWIFSSQGVIKDLGKFESGVQFPQAEIETNCPSSWTPPVKEISTKKRSTSHKK
jgi:dienelactone hydrolase